MNDWVVIVKNRGEPTRRRVFVENIEHEDAAERLALLKLGVDPTNHETSVDLIDARVSVETPNYNTKELLEKALADLAEAQREREEAKALSEAYRVQGEKMTSERDRLIRTNSLILADLALVDSTVDQILKHLER